MICIDSSQPTLTPRMSIKAWARPGFEPGTSRTLSENHTPRSTSRCMLPSGASIRSRSVTFTSVTTPQRRLRSPSLSWPSQFHNDPTHFSQASTRSTYCGHLQTRHIMSALNNRRDSAQTGGLHCSGTSAKLEGQEWFQSICFHATP